MSAAVMVRTGCVQDARDRQIEIDLVAGQTGERGRRNGHAMIGLLPADDLLLARPAERIVHVPDQLDLGIVGLRSGIAEEYFRSRDRRDFLELFGERNRGIVALAAEQMTEG